MIGHDTLVSMDKRRGGGKDDSSAVRYDRIV
jgi:hypothetical protein